MINEFDTTGKGELTMEDFVNVLKSSDGLLWKISYKLIIILIFHLLLFLYLIMELYIIIITVSFSQFVHLV